MAAIRRGPVGITMLDETTIPPQTASADVLGRCESAAQYLAGLVADFDHRTIGEIRDALGLAHDALDLAASTLRELGRAVEDEPTDPGAEVMGEP